ncbi:MAG: sulfatase [Microlunatus sp.]|nr:sulfatase [Microlunatus sp.]
MTGPNIVLIAVDTLRPDHLGCYGYARPTSPSIDRLADQSLVFDRAFAAGIPTTPSFTTLLTGLHPYRHGVLTHPGDHLAGSTLLLPQLAKLAGYTTIGCDNLVVQGGGRGAWFARGYDYYTGFVYEPFGRQSAELTDRALRLLSRSGDEPTFLFVHYWDPHTPYGPCPPYDTMHYQPGSGPVDLADVRAIHPEYYQAFLAEMHLPYEDYAYVVAQYDGEISQVDAQIGRLLDGVPEDAIVLLVSDHGEAFGEGGLYFDHHGLYDGVIRITMMLRVPGQAPGRVDTLVSTEDVLPTLCGLADLPLPDYPLTGRNALTGGRDRIVSVESSRQASLALRTRSHKLILPITEDAGGHPLPDLYGRPRKPDPLLYDLLADPAELDDRAAAHPEVTATMLAELNAWRSSQADVDPILINGLSLPYERFMSRRLARLRAGSAAEPRR